MRITNSYNDLLLIKKQPLMKINLSLGRFFPSKRQQLKNVMTFAQISAQQQQQQHQQQQHQHQQQQPQQQHMLFMPEDHKVCVKD